MRDKAKNIATALLLVAAVVFIILGISSPPIVAKKSSAKQHQEMAQTKTIDTKKSVHKQQNPKTMGENKIAMTHRYFHHINKEASALYGPLLPDINRKETM